MRAEVFDPWPGNGFRELYSDELIPAHLGGNLRFLASASITLLANPIDPGPGPDSSESGGGFGHFSLATLALVVLFSYKNRQFNLKINLKQLSK